MKNKKILSQYKLVHIFWHDAAMHGSQQVSKDNLIEYGIIYGHIAGWLVYENKDFVTIAMDLFPKSNQNSQDSFRSLHSYPKSGIEKITTLKVLKVYEITKN